MDQSSIGALLVKPMELAAVFGIATWKQQAISINLLSKGGYHESVRGRQMFP